MSKRYGRNQRRKAREEAELLRGIASATRQKLEATAAQAQRREAEMAARHAEEIRAARTARDTIRLTIDDLMDPREAGIQMRGRFDRLDGRGYEPVWAAVNLSQRDYVRSSDIERAAFISAVSREFSEYALSAIMRHWRSR